MRPFVGTIIVITILAALALQADAAPTITGVSPTAGGPGTSVTISGSGFGGTQGTSTVKFNGTLATPTNWSDTSIVAGVPATATTGNVVVQASGVDSNGLPFVVLPTPGITGLSPNYGAVSASVTISGANFGSSKGLSTVTFNGTASTPTSWSATVIVVPVPAGATTGNIVVTVNAIASNGVTFTVVPPPNITSLSPSSGAIGASVTIAGTSFGATQGASTVKFNGILAAPASWSATSIVAAVPTGATTGNVVVHASGVDSTGQSFTVLPNITNLSPTSGAVGTSLTITGTSFGPTQGTSTVTFNGVAATIFNWTDTSVIASVPTGVGVGPNPVVLTVAGNGASNGASFTVLPGITRVSPTIAPIGASVNIRGTNFGSTQGSSTITFNNLPVTPANWTDTSVVAPVPSGVTTGPVVAQVGGYASNPVTFTVAASISSISPSLGSAGTPVTITGLNFGATQGTSTVLFNGLPATPTSWANTTIVVPVPTGALTGPITVVVGGASTNGVLFELAPAISSLSPLSGSAGISVTIKGSNFGSQAAGTVLFNGTPTSSTSWTPTSIVAPVPGGATTGPVVITANGIASNGVQFTIGSGTIAGTVTNAGNNNAVSGALVQALQAHAVSGSATTASDGSYSISNLAANSYDVRVSANGFGTTISAGKVVVANATTTVNASLSAPGTLSGTVTQTDGVTAIGGATVTAAQGGTSAGAATTDMSGNYSIAALSAGNYTAQASASGYTSQTQNSATITSGNATTANFSLPGQPVITYTYGRLTSTMPLEIFSLLYATPLPRSRSSISRPRTAPWAQLSRSAAPVSALLQIRMPFLFMGRLRA